MTRLAAGALAMLAALGCRRDAPPPPIEPDAAPAARAAPPARLALLIGVDTYADPGLAPLPGAAHDVDALRGVLLDRFGFAADDVMILRGADATADGIRQAVGSHLVARAGKGTIAVLHFSGHGRRVWDQSGDEPDGWDEAIVPFDGRSTLDAAGILDDEIGQWLDALLAAGAAPTLIFDSCYAGSPARDGAAVRAAPAVGGTRGVTHAMQGTGGAIDAPSGDFVVLSATSRSQKAYEVRDRSGHHHGALTWALLRALSDAPPGATWRTIHAEVARDVSEAVGVQTPQIDGALMDRVPFGFAGEPPPAGSLPVSGAADDLRVEGGALHGVVEGAVMALLSPGAAADAPPLATATVVSVTATAARLSPIAAKLPAGARAIEVERPLTAEAPRIAVSSPEGPSIRAALAAAGFEVTPDIAPLHLSIVDGTARFSWLDREPLGDAIVAPSPRDLIGAAWQWTRWLRLARLEGGAPAAVTLELLGARPATEGRLRVQPGDTVRLRVHNADPQRWWHPTLLALSDDGSITPLWPPPGVDRALGPGRTVIVPEGERGLTVSIPAGRGRTLDVIKLILTAEKVDFHPLVRGNAVPAGHPLLRWLGSTRSGESAGTLERATWAVDTLMVETCHPGGCVD